MFQFINGILSVVFLLIRGGLILKETVAERNYFIDVDTYLAEINRKTIGQILNSFWREKILDSRYDLGTLVFTLPRLKSKIYVHHVNLNSLSRFNSYESVLYVRNVSTHAQIITDPVRLLGILAEELSSTVNPKLLNELRLKLNSHILNALLINWHKYAAEKNDLWRDGQHIYDNSIPNDLADYSYKFEKYSNGPPYYSFGKSKLDFSVRDILDYSPDFQPTIRLMLAAVHTSVVGITTNAQDFDYGCWFARHFPAEWNRWLGALKAIRINAHNYLPLPIHPWQFTHSVQKLFVDLIQEQMLVPLDATIEASPTSSPRTLLSTRNLSAPYVKVPIGIQATSSLRTYPVNTVKTAPAVSQLMATILAQESSISGKLSIISEDIGVYLKTVDAERAQHLTATFRQNVLTCCLAGKEIAISVAALFEKISSTESLLARIMRFAGCTTSRDAVQYFTQYTHLVLGGYLDLYLVYGVALEGHQQNTLAIFENSRVKRFVAKDLTETKISRSVSKSRAFLANVTTSSFFKNFNDFVVRAQLLHAVYQLHLGEILVLVAEHFGCSETLLWRIVADETRERFEALKDRVDGARWRREYDAILKADWLGRSYLQNHFESEYVEKYLYHLLKNPLN